MPELRYLTLKDPYEPARPRHLAYLEWGDMANDRVIVCSHGLSRNARDFDLLAEALSAQFRVICPDMAGRGKSDWLVNKSDYNYALYMSDALALLDDLKLKTVRWIGTSMGGIVGMMLAATYPARVSSLVLNDVGAVVSAEGLRRILSYVGVGSAFTDRQAAMEHLRFILAPFHITQDAHWNHMFDASFIPIGSGRFAMAYDPGINQPFRDAVSKEQGISDVDLTSVWSQLKCPVLLLRGEHSDILSKATAEAMCTRADTKCIEIDGTGHAPALMEESQIEIIRDWVMVGY